MRNGEKDHVEKDGQRVREKWLLKINIERKGEAKMRTRENQRKQGKFNLQLDSSSSSSSHVCQMQTQSVAGDRTAVCSLTLSPYHSFLLLANDTYKQPYKQTNGRDKVSDDGAGGGGGGDSIRWCWWW